MPKHRLKLKRTIIGVLKRNSDRPLSAEQLMHLCGNRLKANYLPKCNNAMGQIMRQMKGVSRASAVLTSGRGNSYVSAVYSLENEEAFWEWHEGVENKAQKVMNQDEGGWTTRGNSL